MLRNILYFLILVSFSLFSQDKSDPVFLGKFGSNDLDISYEKWELENGLTILVHEDHSDPIVYLGVTYHVGSSRENHGKTGYAHFFEHMLCMGSEHAPDKGQWNLVEQSGGMTNASTSYDETNYFQVFPSNYLERIMFLESDRMGYSYNAFDQKDFEAQRGAIKNEKIERCHTPLSLFMILEKLFVDFFPPNHPYNWPIIGYVEDLDRASLNDMRDWLKRWYGPNNATLVISGDVNTKDVISMANKYFGGIAKGEFVRKQRKQPVRLSQDKYISYTDPYTGVPMTILAYPTVPQYHKDEPAVQILSQLLSGGKSTPFYQKFVKKDKAIQAEISQFSLELAGLLLIQYVPRPSMEMFTEESIFFKNIETEVRAALNDFEKEGFKDEDLERIKQQFEAQFIEQYETVSGKARAISSFSIHTSDRTNVNKELEKYLSVTRDDILRVYNKYIKEKPAVILDVKTSNPFKKEKDTLISFNPYNPANKVTDPQYEGLVYKRPKENFDRNILPEISKPNSVSVPEYYTSELSNGLKIIGANTESPITKILIEIQGGSLKEHKKGVASTTSLLLNESTKNFTTEEVSNNLDKIGSSISFSSNRTSTRIIISSLEENIDLTLEILKEKLFEPGFNSDDFERIKKNQIQFEENIEKNRQEVASRVFRSKLFGNNLYGDYLKKKDLKKIKIKDLKRYYNDNFCPSLSSLIVVSNIPKSTILEKISFLDKWSKKDVVSTNNFDFPKAEKTKIYLCDFPGSTQSTVFIGHRSLKYDFNGNSFKNQIINYPLGGNGLTSRLSKIREEGGETYGVSSFFRNDKYGGYFAISSNIRTKGTANSIKELLLIIDDYVNNGVSDEEINITKNNFVNSKLMGYESNYQKLFLLDEIISNDLPRNYTTEQKQIVNNITKDEINTLLKLNIKPDEFIIVIAGNKYVINDELKNLGYEIKEIKY